MSSEQIRALMTMLSDSGDITPTGKRMVLQVVESWEDAALQDEPVRDMALLKRLTGAWSLVSGIAADLPDGSWQQRTLHSAAELVGVVEEDTSRSNG